MKLDLERESSRQPAAILPDGQGGSPDGADAGRIDGWMSSFLHIYGLLVLLGLVIIFFALLPASSTNFFTVANFQSIGSSQAVLGLLVLAFLVPAVGHEFDLSVGSVAQLCALVSAGFMTGFDGPLTRGAELPLIVCVLIGCLLGAFIGLVNGLLVTRLGVDSLIVTLGMATIIGGLVTWYTKGRSIVAGIPKPISSFGTDRVLGVPLLVIAMFVGAVLIWFVLDHTSYGRRLYAIGSNRDAARLVGIPVDRSVLLSFVISGTLAGLAGIVLIARQGGAIPSGGFQMTIAAIAAVFLGAAAIKPGLVNVWGSIIAVYFVAVSVSGLIFAGVEPWIEPVFHGAALIVALALSSYIARRRGRRT